MDGRAIPLMDRKVVGFFLLTPKVRPRGICLFLANMGCGGVGWDVNVHVTLMMFYAARGGWGGVGC